MAIAAAVLALAIGSPAAAQTGEDEDPTGPYPPTTAPYSLDVKGFGTFCLDDAPYVGYDVTPVGFTPASQTFTMRIFDVNGDELPAPYSPQTLNSFTGEFLYPGAAVTPYQDWPGWEEVPLGSNNWFDDTPGAEADAIWRDGLRIEVTYDVPASPLVSGFRRPTALLQQTQLVAYADIQYPPPTTDCNGPHVSPPPPPDNTTPAGTTPAVDPPVGELPKTGSGFGLWRQGIALVLAGGLLTLIAVRRRQHEPSGASA